MAKIIQISPSQFTERFLYLNGKPFSFADYQFMRPIYDIDAPEIVMKFSRQTAKCELSSSKTRTYDGQLKQIKELVPGDKILSFDKKTQKIIINKIKNVEPNGKRSIFCIRTRTGRTAKVTAEHPFWTLNPEWTEAKDLVIGDLIGLSTNNSPILPEIKTIPDHEYKILSFLLAEGGLSSGGVRFSNNNLENVLELVHSVTQFESSLNVKPVGDKYPGQYRITNGTNNNVIITWLKELKLYGKTSADKFLPDLFFKLTKEQIQDALRIWWNTDGYVSVHKNGSPQVGISLISQDLVKGIQELLLRLGIHSTIKQQIPAIYKNTDKKVYRLCVEGIDSINRFYEEIKTYKLKEYVIKKTNNNRLVIPKKAVQPYLNKLKEKYGYTHGTQKPKNWKLSYDLTYTKLNKYIELLKDDYLTTIKNADIIYDRIISIEILPEQDTTAVEMEVPHNTFLVDGLVTHNSTSMANIMLSKSAMIPHFRQLYVSPSVDQTKIFSGDRVAPVIETSPLIKRHYVNSNVSQNVFTKRFLNGSTLYLRYALQSADRLRGLSTDINYYDECYHPDTEVLTNDGWKLFTETSIDKDIFATVNNKGELEYQQASRFIEKDYKGKLIELSGRNFKLLVTPGHNLYVSQDLNTSRKNRYFLETANNVKDMSFKMLSATPDTLKNANEIIIKSNNSQINEISYEGKVYCITVPNSTLFVRNKNQKTPVICGNCQDLHMDIIPVVNQSMSRSLHKKTVFSGTPKRTKGTLAEIWYRSTMYEWFTKCTHCNKWNFLDQKNIGLHGVLCRYCGQYLDTRQGQWVSTGDPTARTIGFRVNLLMFASAPWVDWQRDVIEYRKTCSSDATFYNEVLGLEYDDGVQPITLADLRRCATGGPMVEDPTSLDLSTTFTTLGLDYGPVNSNKSKTVVSVIQKRNEKIKVLYLKRYKGHEADYSFIHGDVPKLYAKWRAAVIGADAGLGDGPNSEIRSRIGQPERLIAFRHSGSQRSKAKWNPKGYEYTLNRNMVMTELFRKIKNRQIEFPRWEDFEPFADDFLNIIIEYDDQQGSYKYVNTGPDDALHSILFGELCLQLLTARDSMME